MAEDPRPVRLRAVLGSGPVLMTLATLSFCIMVASVKVARTELGALEIIAWRSIISIPLAAVFTWHAGLRVRRVPVLIARAGLGFLAMSFFFTATKGLPLADLTLLTRLQPVLIAFIAPLILGARERTGPLVYLALVVGLLGCGILIGPELAVGTRFGLWALAATVSSAFAHTAVRALGKTENPRTVVFWFQLSNLPLALLALFVLTGKGLSLPPMHLMGAVIVCGVAATVGQLLMTKAYQQDRATVVAAASYSGPLWSVALDLMVFGIVPGWTVAIGGALVVAAGFLLYRGQADGAPDRAPSPPAAA